MAGSKVNRFTFDKHSVVLFSALVLAGASSSAAAPANVRTSSTHAAANAAATSITSTAPHAPAARQRVQADGLSAAQAEGEQGAGGQSKA